VSRCISSDQQSAVPFGLDQYPRWSSGRTSYRVRSFDGRVRVYIQSSQSSPRPALLYRWSLSRPLPQRFCRAATCPLGSRPVPWVLFVSPSRLHARTDIITASPYTRASAAAASIGGTSRGSIRCKAARMSRILAVAETPVLQSKHGKKCEYPF
jgi:hypothetical protein